jgi:tetratricopeptide (TPR) repeat protein
VQSIYRLAIAEANTKRIQSAIKHLEVLNEEPHYKRIYEALKADRPGLGFATRYNYFTITEILPTNGFDAMMKLMDEYQHLDEDQIISRRARYNERYPQTILVAKILLWEEMQVQAGVVCLAAIGTPASFALLREFGLSQTGKDSERIGALLALLYEGWIDPDEILRLWLDGEWQEKTLTQIEAEEEDKLLWSPSPEIEELLTQGDEAFERGDFAESERLLQQVVTLEPNAFPAYHQLAVTYRMQGDKEQAKAMLYKALEIHPGYTLARISLAILLLDDEELEGAKEILLPLTDWGGLDDNQANLFFLTQARILVQEGQLDDAVEILTDLLDIEPEFSLARELLESIEQAINTQTVESGFVGNEEK